MAFDTSLFTLEAAFQIPSHYFKDLHAEKKRLQEENSVKCKKVGIGLDKMEEDLENHLEEGEMRMKKRKKKRREMEEGPGRPQQVHLGSPA